MDVSVITQLISSVGFPIAVCLYLFYRDNKLSEQHKQEMDKMSDAINNNTLVMRQLLDKIGD